MDVALITEGTYPTAHGGVSVWCDQLVRGMAAHRFDLYAITGTPGDRAVWSLPGNIREVELIPLWGGGGLRHRRLSRQDRRRFGEVYGRFLHLLTSPRPARPGRTGVEPDDVSAFLDGLHALWEFAQSADLLAGLRSEDTIGRVLGAWQSSAEVEIRRHRPERVRPTIADAVNVTSLLAHCLRPLAVTPRPVALTHSAANGLGALVALAAKWAHGTPFILTEHGVYLRERYLAYRKTTYSGPVKDVVLRFFKLLAAAAYRSADLITPGNAYNQRWARRGGARPELIRTVYNGVEPTDFPDAGAEPDVPTISFMGRIDPIKDVETLIQAFAVVHGERPEARLRIFGGAPRSGEAYLERCRALAGELGVSDVCTFEGRVDNPHTAYAAGHLVALTSVSEGFPYTVVEAMMSGRATVSTDVGGVAEAVGDTGLLVPPRDPQRFGQACLELLGAHERRRELAGAARRRARELFTLEGFLRTYDDIYAEIGELGERDGVILLDDARIVGHARAEVIELGDDQDERVEVPS